VLKYEVNASVGGKLAQIGARLIDSTAKKYANDFFATFSDIAAQRAGGPAAATAAVPTEPKQEETHVTSTNPKAEEMKRLGIPEENVYEGLHWAAIISLSCMAGAVVLYAIFLTDLPKYLGLLQ